MVTETISSIISSVILLITFENVGKLAVFLLVLAIVVNILALLIGFYSLRKKRILFPKFVLFTLYLFYSPLHYIFKTFSIREKLVDEILVEIQNAVHLNKFKKADERKIILIPHCMRNRKCKARCDPLYGYYCKKCGLCNIGEIIEEAEKRDFKVFILPGGSFIKKIFKEYKPTSCIEVACPIELSEAMTIGSKIPVQGVYLKNDGCFETVADINEIIEKMEIKEREKKEKK
ncbi:MAG: DUF116 domain-containing protein [Methanosarcinaceae archaeon]|nr:DUF116 domain-containing protein [Methanosarcinaceae archaeon]